MASAGHIPTSVAGNPYHSHTISSDSVDWSKVVSDNISTSWVKALTPDPVLEVVEEVTIEKEYDEHGNVTKEVRTVKRQPLPAPVPRPPREPVTRTKPQPYIGDFPPFNPNQQPYMPYQQPLPMWSGQQPDPRYYVNNTA